ncbi:HIT family protein [Corynebacterium tapiri]|uniref:HIT domain-containing protein n=1 Tax=Corynebacterium tapiri TaxID=1448266 RepID=A0A5C4U596_9CORY|nr:HIT domain-containing protein [Corynebacterium tapiri]TNL97737.1 HIT domain-containing protein [Corynebacterium tapiri]
MNSDAANGPAEAPDRLERIWAPHRSRYITANRGSDPFVTAPSLSDEEGLIIARGRTVFALLNLYPYNAGHLMVVPYRKTSLLEDLSTEEANELMHFAQIAVRALKRVSRPEAINVGFNLGRSAGGSVTDHLHLHVVPRWPGDSNFMTVISGTKVMPALLEETRAALAQAWREVTAEDEH